MGWCVFLFLRLTCFPLAFSQVSLQADVITEIANVKVILTNICLSAERALKLLISPVSHINSTFLFSLSLGFTTLSHPFVLEKYNPGKFIFTPQKKEKCCQLVKTYCCKYQLAKQFVETVNWELNIKTKQTNLTLSYIDTLFYQTVATTTYTFKMSLLRYPTFE